MIWTDLTRRAFGIACKAHADQVDKGGVPYILHSLTVAEEMTNETLAAVALLHDVCEDTSTTADNLREAGMPDIVINLVEILTHTKDDGMTYMEYIQKIKGDRHAVEVKRADLRHNLNISRLHSAITEHDISRINRDLKALQILDA